MFERPKRRLLHRSPVTLRKSTAENVQRMSVYYWWWMYLKKNKQYEDCCKQRGRGPLAKLYEDFGNVYDVVDFRTWWFTDQRGERLFAEPLSPLMLEELENVGEWDGQWTPDNVLVIAVPLGEPKRRLRRWFNALLLRRHKGKAGIATKQISEALYPVHTKFTTAALEQMLMVYELRQAEPKLTLAEIGQRLALVHSAMPKKVDQPKEAAAKRNIMAATVSRYLKKVTAMIENTAIGKFPCTDKIVVLHDN